MGGSELTNQSDDQRVHGSTMKVNRTIRRVACTSVASVPNDISPERQLSEDTVNKHQFYIRPAVAEYNRRRPRGLAPTATHVEAQLGSK